MTYSFEKRASQIIQKHAELSPVQALRLLHELLESMDPIELAQFKNDKHRQEMYRLGNPYVGSPLLR